MSSPAPRIAITGLGLVTPLGLGAWSTFSSLLAGRTLFNRKEPFPPDIDGLDLVKVTGGILVARHSSTDPAVDLAERAIREALFMAGVQPGPTDPIDFNAGDGLQTFVGASKGAAHAMNRFVEDQLHRLNILAGGPDQHRSTLRPPRPVDVDMAFALGQMGYLIHHLSRRLGLTRITPIVAACASSLAAMHHARQALLHPDAEGNPRRALVITTEAALIPIYIHSYERLGVLAPRTLQEYRSLPLHQDRCGFVLSELAAAVVLERVDDPDKALEYELLNTAVACDAVDLVRTAPGMPALKRVAGDLFGDMEIDMVHPHATATPDHDPAELAVLAELLASRSNPSRLYASKGALGHGLGASGLVSLVIACLAGRTRKAPPMPWLDRPIPIPRPLTASLHSSDLPPTSTHGVFAAGFGGHVAGALLRVNSKA